MRSLTFWIETIEVQDTDGSYDWDTFPVLLCNGVEVWRGSERVSSRHPEDDAERMAVEKLREVFSH